VDDAIAILEPANLLLCDFHFLFTAYRGQKTNLALPARSDFCIRCTPRQTALGTVASRADCFGVA